MVICVAEGSKGLAICLKTPASISGAAIITSRSLKFGGVPWSAMLLRVDTMGYPNHSVGRLIAVAVPGLVTVGGREQVSQTGFSGAVAQPIPTCYDPSQPAGLLLLWPNRPPSL